MLVSTHWQPRGFPALILLVAVFLAMACGGDSKKPKSQASETAGRDGTLVHQEACPQRTGTYEGMLRIVEQNYIAESAESRRMGVEPPPIGMAASSSLTDMLIISRAPGERILIGESILGVRSVAPSIQLVLAQDGQLHEFEFRPRDLVRNPTIPVKDGQVILQRLQRGRVVLAIDAPRDVPVLKGELAGGASA